MFSTVIEPIRHGLVMAVVALIGGALWAAYLATHHEQLHEGFATQKAQMKEQQQKSGTSMDHIHSGHDHPAATPADHHATAHGQDSGVHTAEQHSHSGSLATDAMQRLLRGHIHFMGIGVLAAVLLLVTALTSLKSCWKKVLGWTFGLGALAYPPAWILMGLRTVELGPQAAEASVMWLFAPAVGLLLASMIAILGVLLIEGLRLQDKPPFSLFFSTKKQ